MNKTKSTAAVCAAVLLVFALMGCASDVKSREGSLVGRIADKNGKAVDGAVITWAYDAKCYTYTDENGYFALTGISFGSQTFYVNASNYYTRQFKVDIYSGETTNANDVVICPKSFDFVNITVERVSATSALISWQTTSYTNGMVEYGRDLSLGMTVKEAEQSYATSHSLKLTNLTAQTTYYFKITANREGRSSESSYVDSFTTIGVLEDKTPPQGPTGVTAVLANTPGQTTVFWNPVYDTDLKGYKIYRSELANGSFDEITNVLVPKGQERYVDARVKPGLKYYYRVTAIDQAGNESGFATSNGILAAGRVGTNITWLRANSPYLLSADLTILETGKLTIDSGVEIRIADNDFYRLGCQEKVEITINGTVVASASPDFPIIFAAEKANPPANYWGGISFNNSTSDESSFVNVKISDADAALKIYNSTAVFGGIEAINCNTGVVATDNNNLKLDKISTKRCETGIKLVNNKSAAVLNSTFYNTKKAIVSETSQTLNISGCNMLDYSETGIDTNEKSGEIKLSNNLFVSSTGVGILLRALSPIIEYSTFDSPYCIRVVKGTPQIKKNIFMADSSIFEEGKACVEYENMHEIPPEIGPNNVIGFSEETSYINCTPTIDSTSANVVLMKDITGDKYDYRLRTPYPNVNDEWGISRP